MIEISVPKEAILGKVQQMSSFFWGLEERKTRLNDEEL